MDNVPQLVVSAEAYHALLAAAAFAANPLDGSFPLGIGETVTKSWDGTCCGEMEIEPRPVGSVAQTSTLHSTGVQGITETTESLGRSNVFFAFFGCYTPPCGQCGATIQSLEAKIDCLELNGGGNG